MKKGTASKTYAAPGRARTHEETDFWKHANRNLPVTLLAVDDNPNDLLMLQRALSSALPIHWVCFESVGNAQHWLRSRPHQERSHLPVAILSDLNMPQLSGLDMLKWLRAHAAFHGIPVAIISSFDNPEDKKRALDLGALACFQKPVQREELTTFVNAAAFVWSRHPAVARRSGRVPA